MKKFKSMMSVAVAGMLVLSVFAVGCKNGDNAQETEKVTYSETFKGSVSERTYISVDDTVKGFLEQEISGKATEAVFVGYKEKETISVAEATKELKLDAEDTKGLESVQKIEVEYEEKDLKPQAVTAPMAEQEATPRKVKRIVFVFVYVNGQLRYFVPTVEEGETLVASYFDSIFAPENYQNYTSTADGSIFVSMDMSGMAGMEGVSGSTYSINEKESMVQKRADGVLYSKETYSTEAIEIYILETPKGLRSASKVGNKWETDDLTDEILFQFDSMDDYMLWGFDLSFGGGDHTCFEKTATGYKLKDGMGWVWYQSVVDRLFSQVNIGGIDMSYVSGMMTDYITKFDMEYEMYVSDGKISKCVSMVDMEMNMYGMKMKMRQEMTEKLSAVGKTRITVPKEVKALFE